MSKFVSRFKSGLEPGFKRNSGSTLIEILVTVLLISIAVLGIAGLQVSSLRNLSSANTTAIASQLANDLAERMRSNSTAVTAGQYNHTTPPGSGPDCASAVCSSGQRAAYDVDQWQQNIALNFPGATGTVVAAGGSVFNIQISWDGDRSGSTGTNCPPQTAADLDCYLISAAF